MCVRVSKLSVLARERACVRVGGFLFPGFFALCSATTASVVVEAAAAAAAAAKE